MILILQPMLKFFFIFSILTALSNSVNAQNDQQNSASSNFQPSLFVVIGVLSFMFSLTFILLLYAKMCYQEPTAIHIHNTNHNNNNVSNRGMFGAHTRFSGLDIEIVEALPFFKFSSLKGAKQGLQCSVCLAEFEEIEILRLLPKCKHGFHIECIDKWLENHSTCPLCRQKVSKEDLTLVINSSYSMRLITDSDEAVSSSLGIFVEREDEEKSKSSRFKIGDSFQRIIRHEKKTEENNSRNNNLHRVNHQIILSDVVFKNRWSDVCSSDLMFLNSEMVGIMSSSRISSSNMLGGLKDDETGFKDSGEVTTGNQRIRAMSEIIGVSRLKQCFKPLENECGGEDVKRRRKWFPIAKKTVQWFANRENYRSQQEHDLRCSDIGRISDV